jgi:plasmid maintenance system antidote protein VapI
MLIAKPSLLDQIRSEIAMKRVHLYVLAAQVRCHPSTISKLLSGKLDLTPAMAAKIRRALNGEVSCVD